MYSAVLDTNVLFGNYLRDTLLRLAMAGLYRPLWSADILRELEAHLPDRVGHDRAAHVVRLMRTHFEDAEVTGYRSLEHTMTNDPRDRHVLAAAVRANAAAIVTNNVRHFPLEATRPYIIDVVSADDFLIDQVTLRPKVVVDTLGDMVADYLAPPMDLAGLARRLRPDAPSFAKRLADLT